MPLNKAQLDYLAHSVKSTHPWAQWTKTVLNTVKIPLAFGAAATEAIMSFHGMNQILPTSLTQTQRMVGDTISGLAAGIIESEIYLGNIENATKKLCWRGDATDYQIAYRQAPKILSQVTSTSELIPLFQQCQSASLDAKLIRHLFALGATKQLGDQGLEGWIKQELQTATNQYQPINSNLKATEKLCLVGFSIVTGCTTGLVTTSAIISIGLTGPIGLSIAATIGVLTSIAWSLTAYNKIKECYQSRPWERAQQLYQNGEWYYLLGTGALIAFVGVITVFLAGTWWGHLMTLANIVSHACAFSSLISQLLQGLCLAALTITATSRFVFYCSNILHSIAELGETLPETLNQIKQRLSWSYQHLQDRIDQFNDSNALNKLTTLLRIINPGWLASQAIILPWNTVIFTLHIVSIGVTCDDFAYLPHLLQAATATFLDFLNDFHYVFEQHEHDHGTQPPFNAEEHTHHILNTLNKIIYVPWLVCISIAAVWDWASQWPAQGLRYVLGTNLAVTDTFSQSLDKLVHSHWLTELLSKWDFQTYDSEDNAPPINCHHHHDDHHEPQLAQHQLLQAYQCYTLTEHLQAKGSRKGMVNQIQAGINRYYCTEPGNEGDDTTTINEVIQRDREANPNANYWAPWLWCSCCWQQNNTEPELIFQRFSELTIAK